MRDLPLNLSHYGILVVHPGIHVSTAQAFAGVTPATPKVPIPEILSQPIDSWKGALVNDFEQSVFTRFPEIEMIKERLYALGAVYASMSGSGSSVFGIFPSGSVPMPWNDAPAGYTFFREVSMPPSVEK